MSTKNNLAHIWAERIESCRASGSNVKAWCRENDVSASQYYYWIKKLNTNNKNIENNSIEWAKVSVKPKSQNIDNGNSIVLKYNGFKIEIPKNINREDIAEVLAAIVSIC